MNLILACEFLILVGCAYLCARESRKSRHRAEILELSVNTLQSLLQEFMRESGATFAAFSSEIQRIDRAASLGSTISKRNRILPEKAVKIEVARTPCSPSPRNDALNKKAAVLGLANRGVARDEIASQLMIPRGEIDLILNLSSRAATR